MRGLGSARSQLCPPDCVLPTPQPAPEPDFEPQNLKTHLQEQESRAPPCCLHCSSITPSATCRQCTCQEAPPPLPSLQSSIFMYWFGRVPNILLWGRTRAPSHLSVDTLEHCLRFPPHLVPFTKAYDVKTSTRALLLSDRLRRPLLLYSLVSQGQIWFVETVFYEIPEAEAGSKWLSLSRINNFPFRK